MVRAYVIGNFLLGLLLSVASALLFASVKLPYWLVVAPMSGFLSLAPYIGLPLALIPPLVAALAVEHEPATLYLFLTASVAVLHLLALNLLYPKFVGSRVHLNPLVVTIALMFWGMLWGGIGLVLAIPMTAALKAVCDNVGSLQGVRPASGGLTKEIDRVCQNSSGVFSPWGWWRWRSGCPRSGAAPKAAHLDLTGKILKVRSIPLEGGIFPGGGRFPRHQSVRGSAGDPGCFSLDGALQGRTPARD